MREKLWQIVVGLGVIAGLLDSAKDIIGDSTRLPHWLAMLAAAPIWSLLSTLAILTLLAFGMVRLAKLSAQADAERERRDLDFQAWLYARGQAWESTLETRYNRLASETVQASDQYVRLLDNFHKTYNTRLRDVELMGVEGPWIRLEVGSRVYTLTTLAHDFYQASPSRLREVIERGMRFGDRERWHRESLRRVCGDYYKAEGNTTEWFFDDIASLTKEMREELLNREPALSVWYENQASLRRPD